MPEKDRPHQLQKRFSAFLKEAEERLKALREKAAPLREIGAFEWDRTLQIEVASPDGPSLRLKFPLEEGKAEPEFDPADPAVAPRLEAVIEEGRRALEEYTRTLDRALEALPKLREWAERLQRDFPGKSFRITPPQGIGDLLLNQPPWPGESPESISRYSDASVQGIAGLHETTYESLVELGRLAERASQLVRSFPARAPSGAKITFDFFAKNGLVKIKRRAEGVGVYIGDTIFLYSGRESMWVNLSLACSRPCVESTLDLIEDILKEKVRLKTGC